MEQIRESSELYNIKWYKKGKESAQDYLIEIIKDDELLIHKHTLKGGREWGITTPDNLLRITKKNRGLYEVILTDRKRKVYFDIDVDREEHKEVDSDELFKRCKNCILEAFPRAVLEVSGSVTDEKISYHIILSNWYADNLVDSLCLKDFCMVNADCFFDSKVYTSNRNMKLVNQSKSDGRIQEIIIGEIISKHFITCFFEKDSTNITESVVFKRAVELVSKSEFNLLEIPQLNMISPLDFDYYNSTFQERLNIIPLYPRNHDLCLSHNNIRKILIWSKQVGLLFEEFWLWNKQKEDTKERAKRYSELWKDCDYNIGASAIEAILKRFYPKITQNKSTIKFRHNFEIEIDKIIEGSYLDSQCINPNKKYSLLVSPMGSNKTGSIVQSLFGKRVLWITPRITLSENTLQRLSEKGLNFANYRDFDLKEKQQGKLETVGNVICSIQSLHYLKKDYDIIVIDEIETVLNTFSGDAVTHGSNCTINWMFFKEFLKNAKKVFMMDAFTTKLTINLINNLEQKPNIETINTSIQPVQRYFEQYDCFDDWMFNIIKSLGEGKKLFIFTPFRNGKKGVETIQKVLMKKFDWTNNKQIISYHSGKTKEKKELYNCEAVWDDNELKCVLTNSCITVGVNFNKENVFDEIHCFYSPIISARDFIQSLYRIRHPKSKMMSIYMEDKCFFPEYLPSSNEKPGCKIYYQLQKDLDIEIDANRNKLETLYLMCEKANIRFNLISPEKTSAENRREIHRLLKENSLTVKFDDIKDINTDEMNIIGQIINSNQDTIEIRLQFDKYWFKDHFKSGCMKEAASFWNCNKKNFILRYLDAKYCTTNIIYKLFKENNIEMNKPIKSNPILGSITPEIVQQYFKFHNKPKDNRIDLIMKMINAYFERNVISLVKDKTGEFFYSRVTIEGKQYLKYKTNDIFIWDVKTLEKSLVQRVESEYHFLY